MRYVAVGLMVAVMLLALTSAVPAAGAKRTWTVIAGGFTQDISVVSNAFHPRTVEIAVGDTVTWQIQGFHNIAFLGGTPFPPLEIEEGGKTYINPQVLFPVGGPTYDGVGYRNSGVPTDPSKPFSYSLTFTQPGTYRYVCVVHGPAMGGTVVVGSRATGSPAAAARRGRQAQAASISAGESRWKRLGAERSGREYIVPLPGDARTGFSLLRFTREPLVVPLGATVTWVMRDPFEIHTVTFTSGRKPPEFVFVQPQAQGPPRFQINPVAAAPTPHKNYDGTGFVNSGILFPAGTPPNLPKSYTLSFLKAGTYEYWCLVHVAEGMKGVIIVR